MLLLSAYKRANYSRISRTRLLLTFVRSWRSFTGGRERRDVLNCWFRVCRRASGTAFGRQRLEKPFVLVLHAVILFPFPSPNCLSLTHYLLYHYLPSALCQIQPILPSVPCLHSPISISILLSMYIPPYCMSSNLCVCM